MTKIRRPPGRGIVKSTQKNLKSLEHTRKILKAQIYTQGISGNSAAFFLLLVLGSEREQECRESNPLER